MTADVEQLRAIAQGLPNLNDTGDVLNMCLLFWALVLIFSNW